MIRIGLLGVSGITAGAVAEPSKYVASAKLQGVASRDRPKAERFANQYDIDQVFDDYDALVSSRDIDLVYIALPISLHAQWSIRALRAGKHVLCEKPLAMNVDEVKAMRSSAAESGTRLIEAFHYRYHPAFHTFLDWATNGSLGDLSSITTHFNVGIVDDGSDIRYRPEMGGGAMMDLGCYPVSWILAVTNLEPESVSADAVLAPTGVDESMTARLGFSGGLVGRLSCSMAAGEPMSSAIRVSGEHGDILFENPLAPHAGSRLSRTIADETETAYIDFQSTYKHQLESVASALLRGTQLPTEGPSLLAQQRTLDAIYKSASLSTLRHSIAS